MLILAVDTSSEPCGVALASEKKIIVHLSFNDKKTHSEILMPLIDTALHIANVKISDIDLFAVTTGPGSFTGLRIGCATVKALAHANSKKIAEISTIEMLAENVSEFSGIVCPLMDARRNDVFTGAFRNGKRILNDSAMEINALIEFLMQEKGKILFLGDGVAKTRETILEKLGKRATFARFKDLVQNPSSMIQLALLKFEKNECVNYNQVNIKYLRPSQAERVKKEKNI